MTVIHAGALIDRAPGPKYLAALDFAELAPAEPLPRRSTLQRWREQLPAEGFATALVVPPAARRSAKGPLRFDDAMRAAFEWSREAAEVLDARFVVLPTGGDLTTGQRDRDLLAAWIEAFDAPEGRELVWHPTGLWDWELARPFAAKLGVHLAFDPLETDPPPGDRLLYGRLRALGARSRFTETLLLDVLDALQGSDAEEVYVAIDSPRSFKEAARLAQLAREDA
ncbi:MAG TPA: hypothetical protein VIL20_12255 [Sandaracinaceae bacterium]